MSDLPARDPETPCVWPRSRQGAQGLWRGQDGPGQRVVHPVSTQRRARLPSGEWPQPWNEHLAGVALSQTFCASSAGQGTLTILLEAMGSPFSTGDLVPSWAPGVE